MIINRKLQTMDGNTAAAYVSYAFTELAFVYPITPSSVMADVVDKYSSLSKKENLFGEVVKVVQMQSEAGVAGALHGALTSGSFATTYTASQGLLLMIPNMYKIAGELLPCVIHVAARTVASHALSIFGDQSDVYACRQTGFAMLCSNSPQEIMDLGAVAHLASIEGRVPFLHFFDGFRTSHEIQKISLWNYEDLYSLLNWGAVYSFRSRALNPEKLVLRGTAQNDDIFFQVREAGNKYYINLPNIVDSYMQKVNEKLGTSYGIFNYYGNKNPERIIIAMGSVCETVEEVVDYLNKQNERVGLIKVRLYRPFSVKHFLSVLPKSVKCISILDRTKEPGAVGEPLYLDVVSSLFGTEFKDVKVLNGRYGLSSKDTGPKDIIAVFNNMKEVADQKKQFTVGIKDDVTNFSLSTEGINYTFPEETYSCKFWGFGSDGTVSANKNSIKIIGNNSDMFVQGYFAYDSKKSGGLTVSHLRFGKTKIKSTYYVKSADFVACHNFSYINKYPSIVKEIKPGGSFLLNTPYLKIEELDDKLPNYVKYYIAKNRINFYVIDGARIAKSIGLGGRINTILQSAFFKITNIIDLDLAVTLMKKAAFDTYGCKGENVVSMNCKAIDEGLGSVVKIDVLDSWSNFSNGTELEFLVDKNCSCEGSLAKSFFCESENCMDIFSLDNSYTKKFASKIKSLIKKYEFSKEVPCTELFVLLKSSIPRGFSKYIFCKESTCQEDFNSEKFCLKSFCSENLGKKNYRSDELCQESLCSEESCTESCCPEDCCSWHYEEICNFAAKFKDLIEKYSGKNVPVAELENFLNNNQDSYFCTASNCVFQSEKNNSTLKYVNDIQKAINSYEGNSIPVSEFVPYLDGSVPIGTAAFEKGDTASVVPEWNPENCVQCNMCSLMCPHAVIRPFVLNENEKENAPSALKSKDLIGFKDENLYFSISSSVKDCTSCGICVSVCPGFKNKKALEMVPKNSGEANQAVFDYLISLPEKEKVLEKFSLFSAKGSQFKKPLLEFSGACAGCGETVYAKLVTQLFGSNIYIANATGCSSIWGGSVQSVPYCKSLNGSGPAWQNSLFEDNAEFGLGMELSRKNSRKRVLKDIKKLVSISDDLTLKTLYSEYEQTFEDIKENFIAAENLINYINSGDFTKAINSSEALVCLAKKILKEKQFISKKSTWIFGGDGWAYDIGFGGLDHIFASGQNLNILVFDTEVYSNTGGQASKATPLGAAAQFAVSGKKTKKKNLAAMAMAYGDVYVGSVSLGANMAQCIKAMKEAFEHKGVSLIIAYSPCIEHGIKGGMVNAVLEQKKAVNSGHWQLFRYNPMLKMIGENPLVLDSKIPSEPYKEFLLNENRFTTIKKTDPENFEELLKKAEKEVQNKCCAMRENG